MARCKHNGGNIQQFTEVCLDCGHNIYESDAEYEASLRKDISNLEAKAREKRISDLEERKRELEGKTRDDDDLQGGGWW